MRDGWRETTLGDVATRVIGRTPSRHDSRYWTDSLALPFFTIADMKERYATQGREGVTQTAVADGQAKRVPAGSLLLSFKLSIGKIAITDRDVYPNEAIAWVRPKEGVSRDFLALALEHVNWDELGGRAVKGKTMNKASLDAVRLCVPPSNDQRRIVDLFRAVDDALAGARITAETAFGTYAARGGQLKSGEGTAQPLSTLVTDARSGATPPRGRPEFYGGGIPWVKSGEVAGKVVFSTSETITDEALQASSAWLVPSGAVLVAMYGATAAQVGRLGVPAATNQAVLALVPDAEKVDGDFLYHLLRSDSERLKSLATGAAQPNLSKGVIMRQEYAIPPLEEQRRLGQEMSAILGAGEAAHHLVGSLKNLRSSLLSVLLSGEHEIPASYDEVLGTTA